MALESLKQESGLREGADGKKAATLSLSLSRSLSFFLFLSLYSSVSLSLSLTLVLPPRPLSLSLSLSREGADGNKAVTLAQAPPPRSPCANPKPVNGSRVAQTREWTETTLEATQGQILGQSPTDATSRR